MLCEHETITDICVVGESLLGSHEKLSKHILQQRNQDNDVAQFLVSCVYQSVPHRKELALDNKSETP